MNTIPELVADKLLGGLWSVQLDVWHGSIPVTDEDMLQLLQSRQHDDPNRIVTVQALRDRYPNGIFYRIPNSTGPEWLGFRYGLTDSEYWSF